MEAHSGGGGGAVRGCAEVGRLAACGDFHVHVGGEVIAEPAAHVEAGCGAVIIEGRDDGAGNVPLLPAGKLAEAGFADVEECVVLAAGERRYGHVAEVWNVGRSVELTDEGHAGA